MIVSLLYILLAVLGLSVLIFLHELGHYWMARRVGMRVETFAIGFGKPIYSWEKDGVKWQIGWLPFGGYVKIAGQDSSDERDPYEIPDSFFGKKPIDRIKVSFMGPFVNLVVAFLIFLGLWTLGGREKNFSEYTHKIGWVDAESQLYANGVRPGDEILSYNDHSFESSKDHLYAPMTSPGELQVKGAKIDYTNGKNEPFEYNVKVYPHPSSLEKGIVTSGIINPANYMIYDRLTEGQDNPLPEGSPMQDSGIEYGDRLVWADGELLFSGQQLNHLLNDDRVLLTILRKGKVVLARVPRVMAQEFKIDADFKEELIDWQFEAGLNNIKLQNLLTIPYNLNNDAVVENELKFIDKENELNIFPRHSFASIEEPLLANDKIIAIDGKPIKKSFELLAQLQQRSVNIIVERDKESEQKISFQNADVGFDKQVDFKDIQKIANSIGTNHLITEAGNYRLLKSITPKMRSDFATSPEKQALMAAEIQEQQKLLEQIDDSEKRAHALQLLKNRERQLMLGLPLQDRKVNYNPSPVKQFKSVFDEIWRTLSALVSGTLNPKWISGPIGIVQVVHDNWMLGIKEALFWIGAISLNLGILNLMPIPVLDGGTIMLSLFELVTGKRIPPKTLEKLIIPFAVILIGFFIFLTYQDLGRIFGGFFR
ncbi:MAG: site-2 protease family protein [Parachlamydiaceae bacterium]|nr:site-2 protease family protein [Parachlamydiaceae bacterium]